MNKIKNYLTIKFTHFVKWIFTNFFISFSFSIKDHSWFEGNKILVIHTVDIFDGEWNWALGLKKPGIKTYTIKNKRTFINELGGMMWTKTFNNWYICFYRGKT